MTAATGAVPIDISYERASGSLRSPLVGSLRTSNSVHEVKVESDGGFWTSGWTAVAKNRFSLDVMLTSGKPATLFRITARDKKGRLIAVEPAEFTVAYMLPMAAPPLPHTIAVELVDHHGKRSYDMIFKRNTPWPAEATRSYRAERTLRPSEADTTLPIKFWETDISDDPTERWWAGCVHLRAERVKRPVAEGAELELNIKIDASRKLSVEIFVPSLNESFVEDVYIPEPSTARTQLQQQLDLCFDRLNEVTAAAYEADRDDLLERVRELAGRLEGIAERVAENSTNLGPADPDFMLEPTNALRKIRIQLSQLEEQLDNRQNSELSRKVRSDLRWTETVVRANGSPSDLEEWERLSEQCRKYSEADDPRGLKWVQQRLIALRSPILERLPSHWNDVLDYLRSPARRFVNHDAARKYIATAVDAKSQNDLPAMREACNKAWALLPPSRAKIAKDQLSQPGLRST